MQTQLPILCRKITDRSLVIVLDIVEGCLIYKACDLIKYVDMDGLNILI